MSFRTWLACIIACVYLGSNAAAAEQTFDLTYCSTATVTRLADSDGVVTFSLDGKGIAFSNQDNGTFDNMTFQCAIVGRTVGGKPSGTGYCKYMDTDGDLVVWEISITAADDAYKAVQGTGKWKGIKAHGTATLITKAKPISPELRQVCRRFKGTMEVTKPAS